MVVSDTSPLNYLVMLGRDHVLPDLFGTIVIPPAVVAELSRPRAPEVVRAWIAAAPTWLQVLPPRETDPALDLDFGEKEAIALAQEIRADRILLDDAEARRAAVARGLRVAGTLAVLSEPGERGLLDFGEALAALRQTTFYLDDELIKTIRNRIRPEQR